MLDDAFEALKTFDWGADNAPLKPIDEAVSATGDDAAATAELESRLAAVLGTDAPRNAKDYVCRKLMVIGTAASAPALGKLLGDADNAHMARYALERIPAPEALQTLRDALAGLTGALKIGVISSLGGRRDAESIPSLTQLLGDGDAAVARAAAIALGHIRSAAAGKSLAGAKPADAETNLAAIDGQLACAESLLAEGKKADALAIYQRFANQELPSHIRLAATRGMLAAAGAASGAAGN
jgi:HEAT repeat protein